MAEVIENTTQTVADAPGPAGEAPRKIARTSVAVPSNSSAIPQKGQRPPAHAALPPPDRPYFGWRRGDQLVFGILLITTLVLMGIHWARMSGWGMQPVEVDRQSSQSFTYRLNVNSATWVEWTQLEGVGDPLARRIVADREMNGPFRTIEDLRRVPGIGPKTLEKLRPWLEIPPAPESDPRSAVDAPRK